MTTDTPTTTTDRLVGQTIDGRFRLEALLGKGGMGRVYTATQLSVGRRVAVKVLREEISDSEIVEKRFLREAQVAASLRHPNLVSIIDFGCDEALDALFIVMEFVDGQPLSALIRRGRLRLPLALHVARQVCGGLSEAHAAGIVHRDLKPDNVMLELTAEGHVSARLLDFGIALPSGRETRFTATGAVLGTPHYMAPEQAQDEPVDGRADLHALGVMLYEMLTGRLPWVAETPMAVLLKVVTSPPPPLEEALPPSELPPERVRALLDSLLQKKRDQRPESAGLVARQLDDLIAEFGATLGPARSLDELSDAAIVDRASDELAMLALATMDPASAPETPDFPAPIVSAELAPAPPKRRLSWPWAALPAFLILLGGATALFVSQAARPARVEPAPVIPMPIYVPPAPGAPTTAIAVPVDPVTAPDAGHRDVDSAPAVVAAPAVEPTKAPVQRRKEPVHSEPQKRPPTEKRTLPAEITPPIDDAVLRAKIRVQGGFCPDDEDCTFAPSARAAVCRSDSNCDFDCASGNCTQMCEAEADCRYGCGGGGCQQHCSGRADCWLTCAGGGCTQFCQDEASCEFSCTGGGCEQRKFDSSRVTLRD